MNLQLRHYLYLALICLSYLCLQILYILNLPLAPDEFHFLHKLRELHFRNPYSEIQPYKTLLGQYFQSIVLLWTTNEWCAITFIKLQNAISVILVFAWVFFYLRKMFKPEALLLSLALLFAMSTFLERSAELRVDMLTSLAGLVGFSFLLNRRLLLAGVFASLSFLVSQKGIYYCIASVISVLLLSFSLKEDKEFQAQAKVFLIALCLPVALYLAYWSSRSNFFDVMEMTFFRHLKLVFGDIYGFFFRYWKQTLFRNPIFYLLALFSLRLLVREVRLKKAGYRELALLFYGSAIILLSILHKQAWPYFFVIFLPTLFLLNTYALESWQKLELSKSFRNVCLTILLVFGFLYPLMRVEVVLARENDFQKEMLKISKLILKENETYFAGFDFLMTHEQSMHQLSWLDRERLGQLAFTPLRETERMVKKFAKKPPKFILKNYRLKKLSRPYQNFFSENYTYYYGSIHIYAPVVMPEESGFNLAYSGYYKVISERPWRIGRGVTEIVKAGEEYALGEKLFLKKGWHKIKTDIALRFILQPEIDENLLSLEFGDKRKFFNRVYEY